MHDFSDPHGGHPGESIRPSALPGMLDDTGVRGWLLVLCLMLTVVGPLISTWLVTDEYLAFAPDFASSRGLQAAIFVSIALTACSVAFGVYAGLRLWSIRPGAVNTAKHALLLGLAVDIVTTVLQIAAGPTSTAQARVLHEVTMSLIPSLIFFTVSFAYLNRSTRVHATYAP